MLALTTILQSNTALGLYIQWNAFIIAGNIERKNDAIIRIITMSVKALNETTEGNSASFLTNPQSGKLKRGGTLD